MKKKIIIQCAFNVLNHVDEKELNEDWLKYRVDLFKSYCLKSLKAQTNQWFTALIFCRDETISFIRGEMGTLPANVILVGVEEHKKKINELIEGHDMLYLVRVDSDDMWEKNFVDMLHNYTPKPETEILINQNCYNYEISTGRMASFFYISPQSYVQIYEREEYMGGRRYHLKGGHGGAILLKHEILPGANYMDTVHKTNTLSTFHPRNWDNWKEIEDKSDIEEILKDFGIEGSQ